MRTLLVFALIALSVPVSAATCAHVETGQALDPQPCSTPTDYLKRYTQEVTARWTPAVVPDGTQHNAAATQNQDGSWSAANPAPPAPLVIPPVTTVTVTVFKKRFTLAEKQAIAGSADITVKVFWDELNTATVVDLADQETVAGVDYLAATGLLTSLRAAAILTP